MPKQQSLFDKIPLPTAALLIDTRRQDAMGMYGSSEQDEYSDDVVNGEVSGYILRTLRDDINSLYRETHMDQLLKWRFLTAIIAYKSFGPLEARELSLSGEQEESYPPTKQPQSPVVNSQSSVATLGKATKVWQTIMGPIQPQHTRGNLFPGSSSTNNHENNGHIPNGQLQKNLDEILKLCDVLGVKRFNATSDLGTDGRAEPTRADGTVRLMLLADAQDENSLATAAAYAAHLHERMTQHNSHSIVTMIVCLNHNNSAESTKRLLETLTWRGDYSWSHIGSCILVDNRIEGGANLSKDALEEYVEFLLYLLVLTDPDELRRDYWQPQMPSSPNIDTTYYHLPIDKCFSVGLSSFTYSVRLGRSWLNHRLAQYITQELTEGVPLSDNATIHVVKQWVEEQKTSVQAAIPEHVADKFPQLTALTRAEAVAKTPDQVFPARSASLHLGQRALTTLERYTNELEATYIPSESQEASLQDAVMAEQFIPDQTLRWQLGEGNPLMLVLKNAQRVLDDTRFFVDTHGAVTRAKHQLAKIAEEVTRQHSVHQGTTFKPEEARTALHQQYEQKRDDLEALNGRFPFLTRYLRVPMQFVTLLIWLLIVFVAGTVGLAWVHDLVFTYAPATATLLDTSLFHIPYLSAFTIITGVMLLIFIGIAILCCKRIFMRRDSSSLSIELALLISLVTCAVFAIAVSGSLISLVNDPTAVGLIFFVSWFSGVWVVAAFLAVLILLIEGVYFWKWQSDLRKECQASIEALRMQHMRYVQQVKQHLAETFLFSLLQRAELIDASSKGRGGYYTALEQMHTLLTTVQMHAKDKSEMAHEHLRRITDKGPFSKKLNLREELLDMPTLESGVEILQEQLHDDGIFKEFVHILLRTPNTETTQAILNEREEHPSAEMLALQEEDSDRYKAQLLLSATAASALELSLIQKPKPLPDLNVLEERFDELGYQYRYDLVKSLLEKTRQRYSTLFSNQPIEMETVLAKNALTAWAQVLWEQDKSLLKLVSEGVVTRMEGLGYKASTVMEILNIRTAIAGQPMRIGQQAVAYPFLFPQEKEPRLLREMNIAGRCLPFPDREVFAALSIIHYAAIPHRVQEEPIKGIGQPKDQVDSTANQQNDNSDDASVDQQHEDGA